MQYTSPKKSKTTDKNTNSIISLDDYCCTLLFSMCFFYYSEKAIEKTELKGEKSRFSGLFTILCDDDELFGFA